MEAGTSFMSSIKEIKNSLSPILLADYHEYKKYLPVINFGQFF